MSIGAQTAEDTEKGRVADGTGLYGAQEQGSADRTANRIYVHADIYDKYAEALTAKVKQFKVGPGFDEGV